MKIENGLLFLSAYQLSGDPRFYEESCINACVPIRNISHMKEHPHRGKVYTVLHLDNGDEIIANATIPDLVQLITEANVMNLFGTVPFKLFEDPEIVLKRTEVINGTDLKTVIERHAKRNEAPFSLAKSGVIEPSHEDYGTHLTNEH